MKKIFLVALIGIGISTTAFAATCELDHKPTKELEVSKHYSASLNVDFDFNSEIETVYTVPERVVTNFATPKEIFIVGNNPVIFCDDVGWQRKSNKIESLFNPYNLNKGKKTIRYLS